MSPVMEDTARELAARGELGTADHLMRVTRARLTDGPGTGMRVIDVAVVGGFSVRLLPDRGLDIGDAWYRGVPVAWRSNVGETRPGRADADKGWLDGWGGGLLTTCGLRNVGEPSEGFGQHGDFTDLAADDVSITRAETDDGRQVVHVSATLVDASSLGRCLRVRRVISLTEAGGIRVSDDVLNDGAEAEQAPFLYHVNVGSPFLSGDSELVVSGAQGRVRMGAPAVTDEIREHDVEAQDGARAAIITSPRFGLALHVGWDATELPRVHSWQRNVPGAYVLAVEPANCGLGGRAADRSAGAAPFLQAGERRRTHIELRIGELRQVGEQTSEIRRTDT